MEEQSESRTEYVIKATSPLYGSFWVGELRFDEGTAKIGCHAHRRQAKIFSTREKAENEIKTLRNWGLEGSFEVVEIR